MTMADVVDKQAMRIVELESTVLSLREQVKMFEDLYLEGLARISQREITMQRMTNAISDTINEMQQRAYDAHAECQVLRAHNEHLLAVLSLRDGPHDAQE